MPVKPTRGERNNNPGNIDRGKDKWQGMAADQSADPRFVIFTSPEYGIRAIARLLLNYQRDKGLRTVRAIINRWAPSKENDTSAYISSVCRDLSCGPDDPLELDDADTMATLVRAIIRHENGRVIYADDVILEGIRMAGVHNAPAKPLVKTKSVQASALGLAAVCASGVAEWAKPAQDAASALAPVSAAPLISKLHMALLTIAGLAIMAGLISTHLKRKATGA